MQAGVVNPRPTTRDGSIIVFAGDMTVNISAGYRSGKRKIGAGCFAEDDRGCGGVRYLMLDPSFDT